MKKLKTTLEIGGTINASFEQAARKVGSKLERATQSVRNIETKQSRIAQFQTLTKSVDSSSKSFKQSEQQLHLLSLAISQTDKPSKQLIKEFKLAEKESAKLSQTLALKKKRAKTLGQSLASLGINTGNLSRENAKLSFAMRNSQQRFSALSRIAGADLKGKLAGIARQTRNVSLAFIGVSAAITGVSFKLTKGVADSSDAINTLAKRTGFSTKALQQWQYVTEMAGVPMEKLNSSLDTFSKKLGKAQYGKGTLYSDLRQADSELYDELVAATNTQDAFEILVKRLRETQDKQTREAIVEATLGPLQMASIANLSAKEIDRLKQKKLSLGIVTKKTIRLGTAFGDNLTNIKQAVSGLQIKLAEQLLPSFNQLAVNLERFVGDSGPKIEQWAKTFGQTILLFVPRFLAFTTGLMKGLNAIYKPIDALVTLFGGWQVMAYAVSAVIGGKLLLRLIGLARAIAVTTLALRTLAITSLPSVIASMSVFATSLLSLSTAALPAVALGIRTVGIALVSSPIGIAISALAVGAGLIYANWSKVSDLFFRLKKRFQAFYGSIRKLGTGVMQRLFGKKELAVNISSKHSTSLAKTAKANVLSAPAAASAPPPPSLPVKQARKAAIVTQHITISMQTASNQSHQAIAEHVIMALEKKQARLNRGALYDQ